MSKESKMATLAHRVVTNLGTSSVAVALGCPPRAQLPSKWLQRAAPVHPTYRQRLIILDGLFTQVSKAKSAEAARTWFTSHDVTLDVQPLVAIRYRRFADARKAAAQFISSKK